jgi:hypothetical protein
MRKSSEKRILVSKRRSAKNLNPNLQKVQMARMTTYLVMLSPLSL